MLPKRNDDRFIRSTTQYIHEVNYIECVQVYLRIREEEGLAKATLEAYFSVFRRFNDFLIDIRKDRNLTDVNELDIRNYITKTYDDKQIRGINKTLSILKMFFTEMYEREVLTKNPTKFIKKKKGIKKKKEILSDREIKILLGSFKLTSVIELRNLMMIMIFLDTGMRLSEMAFLNIENINIPEGKINFYAQKVRKYVEGFLTSPTLKVVETYQRMALKGKTKGALLVAMDSLNPTVLTQNRLSKQRISTIVKVKGEELGIKLNPHKFRHTFATKYIRNGGDQFSLKQLMGHSCISSTDVYVNLGAQDLHKKHNNFNIMNNIGGDL